MKTKIFTICTIVIYALNGCSKEGPIGKKSLIDMAIETKGENCSSGGFKVLSGIDLNDNNILDDSEVQSMKYICNGNNGTNSLLNISQESVGVNCLTGGYKVTTGIDQNSDNILDMNEIQKTEYICNGANGANGSNGSTSLMNVIPEQSGLNCSSGGFMINSGIDLNNNGNLDNNEIQSTQYICNGDDGGYDKQIRVYFPDIYNETNYTTSINGIINPMECIYDFDITKYLNADSIVFGSYLSTYDINVSCFVELFDITNNRIIDNTLLTSNSLSPTWEYKSTTLNFLDNLPHNPIRLGIKVRPQIEGTYAKYYLPMITIYRK